MKSFAAAAAAAIAVSIALPARAAGFQDASMMFTEDGVGLGVDSRVFALFTMLNGLGFDDDTQRGPAPLHKPLFAAARLKARGNLGGRGSPALKALEAVIAKHGVERDQYVAAVLELGPAPNFDDKGASSPLAKAIAGPIRDWYNEEGGAGVQRLVADEARATQKRLLPALDKAVKATTALVRLGDKQDQLLDDSGASGRVVVVLNELDAHSTIQRAQKGDTTFIVVGPPAGDADDQAIATAAVAAYARTLVAREAPKGAKPGSLADSSKITKAKLDDKAYATELLACAFAQKVRGSGRCVGSPVDGDTVFADALTVLGPRVDAFATDTGVLSASVEKLLEAPPPPPPPPEAPPATPPVDDKKGGKKGGKGK